MSNLHHSEETHQQLVERLPSSTGVSLPEWFERMNDGPSLLRFDEKVNWLRDEHGLSHGFATAVVHEHDKHLAARRMG
jgi:hypothetical protein